jgi:hypothetical protein
MSKMSRDSDTEYLIGCSVAAIAGLITLAPVITFCVMDSLGPKTAYSTEGLTQIFVKSAIVAGTGSAILSLLTRLPAAIGGFGGIFAGGAYWLMYIQQVIVNSRKVIGREPDYVDSTMFLVPVAWIALGAFTCFLPMLLRKRKKTMNSS